MNLHFLWKHPVLKQVHAIEVVSCTKPKSRKSQSFNGNPRPWAWVAFGTVATPQLFAAFGLRLPALWALRNSVLPPPRLCHVSGGAAVDGARRPRGLSGGRGRGQVGT